MTNVTDTAPGGRSRRRVALILVAIVAVLAVILTGGALAYAKQFEGRALPGTMVLGQDVSGKSPEEIAALFAAVSDPAMGYLTGTDILCDGGCVAGARNRRRD